MEITRKNILTSAGINVDDALERCLDDAELFEELLSDFQKNTVYSKLVLAIENKDIDLAIKASHTLKGMCGNLSMEKLFKLFSSQVAAFRNGEWDRAVDMMDDIAVLYNKVIAV